MEFTSVWRSVENKKKLWNLGYFLITILILGFFGFATYYLVDSLTYRDNKPKEIKLNQIILKNPQISRDGYLTIGKHGSTQFSVYNQDNVELPHDMVWWTFATKPTPDLFVLENGLLSYTGKDGTYDVQLTIKVNLLTQAKYLESSFTFTLTCN
jgi:hypothetical protein